MPHAQSVHQSWGWLWPMPIYAPDILYKMKLNAYLYTLHTTRDLSCTPEDVYNAVMYTLKIQAIMPLRRERPLSIPLLFILFKPPAGRRSASCQVQRKAQCHCRDLWTLCVPPQRHGHLAPYLSRSLKCNIHLCTFTSTIPENWMVIFSTVALITAETPFSVQLYPTHQTLWQFWPFGGRQQNLSPGSWFLIAVAYERLCLLGVDPSTSPSTWHSTGSPTRYESIIYICTLDERHLSPSENILLGQRINALSTTS